MLPREATDLRRVAEPAARPLRRLVPLALAAAAIGGCGEEGETTTSTRATTSVPTDIVVTFDADGQGGDPAQEVVVTCPGGDNRAACEAISSLPEDPAAPVPPDAACTTIYGGPETLAIQGTLNGEVVNSHFDRGDGCQIERFDTFVPLVKALYPDYQPGGAPTG